MRLVLFRHGLAEERESFGSQESSDHLRPLTEKGRKRVKQVCERIRVLQGQFDMVVSSPLLRAQQTRDIATQVFSVDSSLEAVELSPSSPPQAFVKWLRFHAKRAEDVLVVGHEPQLSLLASYLLAQRDESFIQLRKAGMICLEVENFESLQAGTALLVWAISPKLLLKK